MNSNHRLFVRRAVSCAVVLAAAFALSGCGHLGSQYGSKLVTANDLQMRNAKLVHTVASDIAKAKKIEAYEVEAKDVRADKRIKDAGLDTDEQLQFIQAVLGADLFGIQGGPDLSAFSEVDVKNKASKLYNYSVRLQDPASGGKVVNMGEQLAAHPLVVVELSIQAPAMGGSQAPQPAAQVVCLGPVDEEVLNKQLELAKGRTEFKEIKRYPVSVYMDAGGHVALGVGGGFKTPEKLMMRTFPYFPYPADKVNAAFQKGGSSLGMTGVPRESNAPVAAQMQ